MSLFQSIGSSWVDKWGQRYSNIRNIKNKIERAPKNFCQKLSAFLYEGESNKKNEICEKVIKAVSEAGVFNIETLAKNEFASLYNLLHMGKSFTPTYLLKHGFPILRTQEQKLLKTTPEVFPEHWRFHSKKDIREAFESSCYSGDVKKTVYLYELLRSREELAWESNSSLLVETMQRGCQELALKLLFWDCPLYPDSQGNHPVHIAAEKGWLSFIHWLEESRINFEIEDQEGRTPLEIAAINGHTEIFEFLAGEKEVSLELALLANSQKYVNNCLEGMDINELKKQLFGTPQRPTSWFFEVVSLGVSRSAVILNVIKRLPLCEELFDLHDKENNNILHVIGNHSQELIEAIFVKIPKKRIKSTVNFLNKNGETPLYSCFSLSDANVFLVEKLISSGALLVRSDFEEDSILRMAVRNHYPLSSLKLLLNLCNEEQKQQLCKGIDGHNASILYELVQNMNLSLMTEESCVESLKFLIASGADPYYKDQYDQTILDYAIRDGNFIIAKFLLDTYNVSFNVHNDTGFHALHYVAMKNAFSFFDDFKELLTSFLDVVSKEDDTAMTLALGSRSKEMVERLIALNAVTLKAQFPLEWQNDLAFADLTESYRELFVYDRTPLLDPAKEDFTLIFNRERFSDHRLVLTSSRITIWIKKDFIDKRAPGLASLLDRGEKTLLHVEDEEAFKTMLECVYGRSCVFSLNNFKRLAKVAVEYKVEFLKQELSDWLQDAEGAGFEDWSKYLKDHPRGTKRKNEEDTTRSSKYVRSDPNKSST